MVKYAARGTAFASSSLGLSCQLNRRFQVEDYPELEHADFLAVYEYAANVGKRVTVEAAV